MSEDRQGSLADVEAGVRQAVAGYARALDDGRVDALLATFWDDATVDIPGLGSHAGHDALRAAYERWQPQRPQRHIVANTLLTSWTDDEASAVSDLVFLLREEVGWVVKVVGRYEDSLRRDPVSGRWRFTSRRAEIVP